MSTIEEIVNAAVSEVPPSAEPANQPESDRVSNAVGLQPETNQEESNQLDLREHLVGIAMVGISKEYFGKIYHRMKSNVLTRKS